MHLREECMKRLTIAVISVSIGLLGPCSWGRAAEWDDVIAAAKREGSVVLYTTALGAPFNKTIGAEFQAKYGIPVSILDLRGSEVRERIRIEQTSGRALGDVVHLSPSSLSEMQSEGSIVPLGHVPNQRNLQAPFERDTYTIPSQIYGFGILVNTNLVKPEDEPKRWWDLTDPKWRGKILSDDFRAAGGGQTFFEATYLGLGPEFHQKVAQQNLIFSRELGVSERRVGMAEFPLRIPQHLTTFLALKGLPVKFIAPSEGMTYVQFNSSVIKNAPHPNAALLLINHYLEKSSQLTMANVGLGPVISGVAEQADASVKGVIGSKLLGTNHPGNLDKMLGFAQQLYK
jgi:iron(III) transport system substrate-binding protein